MLHAIFGHWDHKALIGGGLFAVAAPSDWLDAAYKAFGILALAVGAYCSLERTRLEREDRRERSERRRKP